MWMPRRGYQGNHMVEDSSAASRERTPFGRLIAAVVVQIQNAKPNARRVLRPSSSHPLPAAMDYYAGRLQTVLFAAFDDRGRGER